MLKFTFFSSLDRRSQMKDFRWRFSKMGVPENHGFQYKNGQILDDLGYSKPSDVKAFRHSAKLSVEPAAYQPQPVSLEL